MVHYVRLRPRLNKLTLPFIWLGLISAGVSFSSTYQLEAWIRYTIYGTAFIATLILWGIPSLRYAANFIDVNSTGLLVRMGFGSTRMVELAFSEIAEVRNSALKGITIRTKDDREFVLRGYANQKGIVAELSRIVLGK